jgi:hypothetical protein
MSFRNIIRRVGQINFTAINQTLSLDLPRKDFYRHLILRLTVVDTITTLGSPVLYANTPAQFLSRIEVIADGKDTIKSINGRALMFKNFMNYSTYPRRTVPTLSAAAMTWNLTLVLPFSLPRSIREIDTILDTGKLSTLELRITGGDSANFYSTAPTTRAFTSANLEVLVHEAIKFDTKPVNPSVYKEMSIQRQLTATANEFQLLLPVGNLYRGFLIESIADSVPVNTIIQEIQIRSGTTVFFKAPWNNVRELNAIFNNMETQAFDGYAYVEFCPEGRLVDSLDSSKLSMLEAVFNSTLIGTTDFINIYPEEIIVPALVRK